MHRMKVLICCMLLALLSLGYAASGPFSVATVEFQPLSSDLESTIKEIRKTAEAAALKGAKFIVFPEMAACALGSEGHPCKELLDTIPGKTTQALEKVAAQFGIYIAIGIAETDPATSLAFNAAALIGPKGYIGKYRKVGLSPEDQIWASPGNLGHPLFKTEFGSLALLIGYDDVYFQTSRLSVLKGADLIALSTCPAKKRENGFHTSISFAQSIAAWNGVYLICASRPADPASLPTATSFWDPQGKALASVSADNGKSIFYAKVDPQNYENPNKRRFSSRRPELYRDLTLFRAPSDPHASQESVFVASLSVQYTPLFGDKAENWKKIRALIEKRSQILEKWNLPEANLIVFPAYTLTGFLDDPERMKALAEKMDGASVSQFAEFAVDQNAYIVFSFLESSQKAFYHTAVLISPEGELLGTYRQTHLEESAKKWMSAGGDLPVFRTNLGRIGIFLDTEVLYPEIAGALSINRADIIAIPSQWNGSYAPPVAISREWTIRPFPQNTHLFWYSIAQAAQSYVIAANFVGGQQAYRGSSGLYSFNPLMGYPPFLASSDREEAFYASFRTLGDPSWWINQEKLIIGRRADLAIPMVLPMQSPTFIMWKNAQ